MFIFNCKYIIGCVKEKVTKFALRFFFRIAIDMIKRIFWLEYLFVIIL